MRSNKYIFFILFIILLAIFWVVINNQAKPKVVKQPDKVSNVISTPQVVLKGTTFALEIVDTPDKQRQGLSGRENLATNQAMLFIFDQPKIMNFWMKDMKFNIDLLWINGNEIVAWEKNMLAPEIGLADDKLLIYTSPFPVDKVLELSSGTIDSLSLQINDKIELLNVNNYLNN